MKTRQNKANDPKCQAQDMSITVEDHTPLAVTMVSAAGWRCWVLEASGEETELCSLTWARGDTRVLQASGNRVISWGKRTISLSPFPMS